MLSKSVAINYFLGVVIVTIISAMAFVFVQEGQIQAVKGMQYVCGVACFPHDIFFPWMKSFFGLPDTPKYFGIPLWNIIGGFFIMAIYFSLLFLPLLGWHKSKGTPARKKWLIFQLILIGFHMLLFFKITLPII